MKYRLLVSIEVVEFLERLPSRIRKPLRNVIESIGNSPNEQSDAADFDNTGRRLEIAYWIDDADRHVKILDIHLADQ